MTRLAPLALVLLAGCTTASFEDGTGMRLTFTRFWSDVSFSAAPDGTVTYSSDADSAAAQSSTQQLLNALLPLLVPQLQARETP